MCQEIVVYSLMEAEEFECPYEWAAISIANEEDEFPVLSEDNRIACLRLAFADITRHTPGYNLFHHDQAHDIFDFVSQYWGQIHTLMIHCYAGISRSAAVAAAIGRIKFDDEGEFSESPYDPNPYVYRLIREVASGRSDYQDNETGDW